jgi:hypothetical protein
MKRTVDTITSTMSNILFSSFKNTAALPTNMSLQMQKVSLKKKIRVSA